jgi:rhamnulokinase
MTPEGAGAPQEKLATVAVDLGAESCRVSLLRWSGGSPRITLVHRIANGPVAQGEQLRWNLQAICAGVEEGLRRCARIAVEGIASIAVDGWATDYVRLNGEGVASADPFCYRDPRTIAAERAVHERIDVHRLYALTGLQRLRFNTVYQLYADQMAGIPASVPWINLPEYVLYRLGGRRVAEYTNATHTGLVSVAAKTWCAEVFDAVGLDPAAAPELVPPGTVLGVLRGPLADLPALRSTRLIAPACHDTASATAGIPGSTDESGFISSGTWSLVGSLLDRPCNTPQAFEKDFTNQGAVAGRISFHKNVNGMWLLRQCIEHWNGLGRQWSVPELIAQADGLAPPDQVFNVDEGELMLPGNVPARINEQRRQAGLDPLSEAAENAPAFTSLILHSLAARYAEVFRDLTAVTGKRLRQLYIVGGGSRNALLNRLTQDATGLEVRCGYVESATIGNLAIQLAVGDGAAHAQRSPDAKEIQRWASALGPAIDQQSFV